MNTKRSKTVLIFIAVAGLAMGHSYLAFADSSTSSPSPSWWQLLSQNFSNNNSNSSQSHPWWQFWNQTTPAVSPNATDPTAAANDAQLVTHDQQVLTQDKTQLQTDYGKLRSDRATGVDTTVDQQAIATDRQNLQNHVGNLRNDQGLLTQANLPPRVGYDEQVLTQDKTQLQQAYQKLRTDRQAGVDTTADLQSVQALKQTAQDHQGNLRYDAQSAGLPVPPANNGNGNWKGHEGYRNYPPANYNNGAWQGQQQGERPWQKNNDWHQNNEGYRHHHNGY